RADGGALSCRQYDRLTEIDQGAIVEHKRLSHVLQVAQMIQAQRDNSRIGKAPSRTHLGVATRAEGSSPGKKKER
ncbi:ISNCY family transposase, partial [Paraburkholderia terricola]